MKMTVEGIILNETNYGETSKILNILTKEYGYISVMSKGSRTIKSRLRGISMRLVYGEFVIIYKKNGISILQEGNVLDSLKNILTDIGKMTFAIYLIDFFKSILKESFDVDMYSILKEALLKINAGFDPSLITNIVEIKLLKYLGVAPHFNNCILCGNEGIITFDMNLAGFICKNCYRDTYIFSTTTLKLLKLFFAIDIKKITKLNIKSNRVRKEINQFIQEYYEIYTGIYIKNKDNFLKV